MGRGLRRSGGRDRPAGPAAPPRRRRSHRRCQLPAAPTCRPRPGGPAAQVAAGLPRAASASWPTAQAPRNPAASVIQPFVRPAGGRSNVGTPFVPTAPRSYGAQERSRDETALRRAQRARPLTAPSTVPAHQLSPDNQRSEENSIGTSGESSIGIDSIRGQSPERRLAVRQQHARPLPDQLKEFLDTALSRVSGRVRSHGPSAMPCRDGRRSNAT